MKPLPETQARVLDAVAPLPAARIPVWRALGTVLAEDVTAPHDVPPFANSAMDGFAVRAVDVADAPTELRILEDIAAGHVARSRVEPGTAVRIMTGAPIPSGADAVVRVEDTTAVGDTVTVEVAVEEGTAIRPAGGDVPDGATVFAAGTRLRPAHLGVLATLGVAEPVVHRRPRVAVLSTGDEVKPPETVRLEPGWIRDANRPLLVGLLSDLGVDIHDYGIVPDDAIQLEGVLRRAAAECDVIVTSGGVSMGDYDVVKAVIARLGEVDLYRVAMKPGKPFAFGTIDATPFFGLPGNPVSVMVSFEQFARPALLTMMGARELFRPRVAGVLTEPVSTDPEKTVFLRMVVSLQDGVWEARSAGGQASNVLSAAAIADALAVVPVGTADVEVGAPVHLEMLHWPATRTREEVLGG